MTTTYCPAASGECDEYISSVEIDGTALISDCSFPSYTYYDDLSFPLHRGDSYPLSITNGNPYTGDQCGVWIDWNHDFDFNDANETYTMSGGPTVFTTNIVVPSDALIGEARMRTKIMYTGELSPCGWTEYGEIEDYSIDVYLEHGVIEFVETDEINVVEKENPSESGVFVYFKRTEGSEGVSVVGLTSINGNTTINEDYIPIDYTLTWQDGDTSVYGVWVEIIYDQIDEGIENFALQLTPIENSEIGFSGAQIINIYDPTTLNLKAFLQGPYNPISQIMNDYLRADNKIPFVEPYTSLEYYQANPLDEQEEISVSDLGNYYPEYNIVDWVFVEIYDLEIPESPIITKSGVILQDGTILDVSTGVTLGFNTKPMALEILLEDFEIVVRHRNHFGVKTYVTHTLGSPVTVDLTNPETEVYGTNAMLWINGKMVMIAGDANSDGQINAVDKNGYWRLQNGLPFDYINSNADFNLDGSVNAVDKNAFWRINNSLIEQLD